MKLENQVCSLELAKKLKELGVKQESLWHWKEHRPYLWKKQLKAIIGNNNLPKYIIPSGQYDEAFVYSAFTVAELAEMLPNEFSDKGKNYYMSLRKNKYSSKTYSWGLSYSAYWDNCYEDMIYSVCEDTEANARAKMLIWLIENKKGELIVENK